MAEASRPWQAYRSRLANFSIGAFLCAVVSLVGCGPRLETVETSSGQQPSSVSDSNSSPVVPAAREASSPLTDAAPTAVPSPTASVSSARTAGNRSLDDDRSSATTSNPSTLVPLSDSAAIERRLHDDLNYLASDELGGRGPFTEGLEKAAHYLARKFAESGLQTQRFGSPPFQTFRSNVKLALGDSNRLRWTIEANDKPLELAFPQDFTPLSLSGEGAFDSPLAFVRYGITCPELQWDDYAGRDVSGKIVVVLRHAPASSSSGTTTNGGKSRGESPLTPHTYLASKVTNAIEHGAAGIIFVTDAGHLRREQANDETANATDDDPLLSFQVEGKLDTRSIPVVHVRRAALDRLLTAAGRPTIAECESRADSVRDAGLFEGWHAAGEIAIERRTFTLKNVLGEIPGQGSLADETVIVGAHYDHLGNGGISSLAPWTKAIHNGADDNASGTTALLEVARQVVRRRDRDGDARRVLFVAFSAEEMGLIGSERFVASPPVPLDQVVAMVNLDMVGRLRADRLTVSGTGTAREFSAIVQRLASHHEFRAKLDPSGLGPSDHATFAVRGIPVLHFFTGLHEDYHRPSDDADRINVVGLRRISLMVADTIDELSKSESRPTPTREGLDGLLADVRISAVRPRSTDSTAKRRADSPPTARPLDAGLTFQDTTGGGVTVRSVAPGSPAQRAGLRVGDVLKRVGEQDVSTSRQAHSAARTTESKPVSLRILRGCTELDFELRP